MGYPITEGVAAAPEQRTRSELAGVLAYDNEEVVERLVRKLDLTIDEAEQLFSDLKKFLYLAGKSDHPLMPSKTIDDAWHQFILYTSDYAAFCRRYFNKFIHHKPPSYFSGNEAMEIIDGTATYELALAAFGTLSANWTVSEDGKKCTEGCSTSK